MAEIQKMNLFGKAIPKILYFRVLVVIKSVIVLHSSLTVLLEIWKCIIFLLLLLKGLSSSKEVLLCQEKLIHQSHLELLKFGHKKKGQEQGRNELQTQSFVRIYSLFLAIKRLPRNQHSSLQHI